MLKPTVAILMGLLCISASAQTLGPIVVVMDGANTSYSVTIDSKKPVDLLRAFSQIHRDSPGRPIRLLIHSEASISRLTNLLGIMSKAELPAPTIFVFTKERDTMVELSVGCVYLFSDRPESAKLAHGRSKCP